ncbi:hypothetical protein [Salipiger sp.]|uniref:hypothetical protein n=1 Tax=Salipiger sp. TaxID=2078585 RepID=UPI003A98551B
MRKGDDMDPKGLIREAYRMDGLGDAECRSIFLDWALSMPEEVDARAAMAALLERHGGDGHPMTAVLREGLSAPVPARRRGGRGARRQ